MHLQCSAAAVHCTNIQCLAKVPGYLRYLRRSRGPSDARKLPDDKALEVPTPELPLQPTFDPNAAAPGLVIFRRTSACSLPEPFHSHTLPSTTDVSIPEEPRAARDSRPSGQPGCATNFSLHPFAAQHPPPHGRPLPQPPCLVPRSPPTLTGAMDQSIIRISKVRP